MVLCVLKATADVEIAGLIISVDRMEKGTQNKIPNTGQDERRLISENSTIT